MKKKLPAYMTDAQRAAWESYESRRAGSASDIEDSADPGAQKGKFNRFA